MQLLLDLAKMYSSLLTNRTILKLFISVDFVHSSPFAFHSPPPPKANSSRLLVWIFPPVNYIFHIWHLMYCRYNWTEPTKIMCNFFPEWQGWPDEFRGFNSTRWWILSVRKFSSAHSNFDSSILVPWSFCLGSISVSIFYSLRH